jgi:hypothetical protein
MKNKFFSFDKKNVIAQMFLLILFVITSTIFLPGCSSGSNVGEIVCNYGTTLCDVGTVMCNDIPGVPPEVCNYLDLACYNLNVICSMADDPENPAIQKAASNIEQLTEKLRTWKVARDLEKQKQLQQSKK